jgi:hypothetical protein
MTSSEKTKISFEVDKETFEKMRDIFAIYDKSSNITNGLCTVKHSFNGIFVDSLKECDLTFAVHRRGSLFFDKDIYKVYIDCASPKLVEKQVSHSTMQ